MLYWGNVFLTKYIQEQFEYFWFTRLWNRKQNYCMGNSMCKICIHTMTKVLSHQLLYCHIWSPVWNETQFGHAVYREIFSYRWSDVTLSQNSLVILFSVLLNTFTPLSAMVLKSQSLSIIPRRWHCPSGCSFVTMNSEIWNYWKSCTKNNNMGDKSDFFIHNPCQIPCV